MIVPIRRPRTPAPSTTTGRVRKSDGACQEDIATNMNLKARYLLFASYEKLNNIDQRLDMTLTAKVNRVVNVTINGTFILQ